MSLILDALKRAERERRGEAGPAPAELPPPAVRVAPRRERDWVWTAVVVGGLGLSAFLLWDAFRKPPVPAAPPPAPAPQAQAPAAPPAQAPVIVARPAPPPASVVPGTEGVASLDDLTDEPVLEGAPAAPLPKPVPAKPARAKPAATAGSEPRPSTIATTPAPPPAAAEVRTDAQVEARPPPAQPAPDPAPAEARPAQPPAAEVPPALTQPAPLRKFREMPPDYRADFPALRVEIHVYEKEPARRFVMINGRRYREGERLAEGPALVEIVPEGMVLEHRGEKVLYTLGR
jgi:general secretion pathway protein B